MAFVQSKANQLGVAGLTVAATYTNPVTAGNLLVAAVGFNSTDTVTVDDSVNGSWISADASHTGTGGVSNSKLQFFYFSGTSAGTPVVTATASGSHVPFGIAILEYSSVGQLDGTVAYNDSLATTTPTTSSIVTAGSVDVIVAATITFSFITFASAPFTLRESTNWGGNGVADLDSATPGSYSATFNQASGDAMLGIVAFGPVSAAPSLWVNSGNIWKS